MKSTTHRIDTNEQRALLQACRRWFWLSNILSVTYQAASNADSRLAMLINQPRMITC